MRLISCNRSSDSALLLVRGVQVTPVDDGCLLLDPRGRVLHLNLSAAVMMDALLIGGLDAAVTATRRRFGIAEETARADVTRLLIELRDRKLVRWR